MIVSLVPHLSLLILSHQDIPKMLDLTLPVNPQSQSPLFSLPAELRLKIFSFALTDSLDLIYPYSKDTYFYRLGHTAPCIIHIALLLTCRRIYAESHPFPHLNATHTFFLCSRNRAPSFLSIWGLEETLAQKFKDYGPLDTPHIQVFAQLYQLENDGAFQEVLEIEHLRPRRVTLTIRHTDFWFWEDWDHLRLDGDWVNEVRFPDSVVEFRMELESIGQRAAEIDYLAAGVAREWFFLRMDGRVLRADLDDLKVSRWTGSSVLTDRRWLRDEARPGELDYHVVTVRWKLVPTDEVDALRLDLSVRRPKIRVPDGFGQKEPAFPRPRSISVKVMQRLKLTKETPLDEVLRALEEAGSDLADSELEEDEDSFSEEESEDEDDDVGESDEMNSSEDSSDDDSDDESEENFEEESEEEPYMIEGTRRHRVRRMR